MRAGPLRRDPAGAIDIPYKLLVSVVIMALATTVLLPVLRGYQESTMEDRVNLAVSKIAAAARTAYHHPGSSRTVVVDVPPAGVVHLGPGLGVSGLGVLVHRVRGSGRTLCELCAFA